VSGASDDSSDVRSVAVVVVRRRQEIHEISKVQHALRREIVVRRGDARIDHRDAYAGPIETEVLMNPTRADGCSGSIHRPAHRPIQAHRLDFRPGGKRVERRIRDLRHMTGSRREPPANGAADATNERFDRVT
jgi:hypothetical protein